MRNIIVLFITSLTLISCNESQGKKFEKLNQMNWLVGQWENKSPDGLLTESWTKDNDSTFSGKAYFIKNEKDTIHFETIVLFQSKDEVIYRPTVKGQNNDEPVDFKFVSETKNNIVFENTKHDYPQKITYIKTNDTSMVISISGDQQGKTSTENFPMIKK